MPDTVLDTVLDTVPDTVPDSVSDSLSDSLSDVVPDINNLNQEFNSMYSNIINILNKFTIKTDIWLIKKSACKTLTNRYIVCTENTYIKKNSVRENKNDPDDKIYINIGKKLKLHYIQQFNFFYIIEYNVQPNDIRYISYANRLL